MTCKAELHIGDDYGDNQATMHCQLEEGHAGKHRECFRTDIDTPDARNVMIEWEGDDREEEGGCPECRGTAMHKMDCSRRGEPLPK